MKAVYAVLGALQRALGGRLIALYRFGGLSACTYSSSLTGICLLIVISDDTRVQEVREALRQVWRLHSSELGQVPLVVRRAAFLRHVRLDPILAHDLMVSGEKLSGESLLDVDPAPEQVEILARIADQSMIASAVLAPTMISQQEVQKASDRLRCLSKKFLAEDYSVTDSAARVYSGIQRFIAYQLERYPELIWSGDKEYGSAPVLEVLLAVYSMENRLILVLPDLPANEITDRIISINWRSVASRIAGEYRGLHLSTPTQLRLILQLERAAEYSLGTYEHAWGLDPLGDLDVKRWRVFRDLARLPSDILIDMLPRSLIVCDDNDLPVLVHDLQNKLLNIQLRNELFSRAEYSASAMPPEPLPDRSAPSTIRIQAIADQLEWWAEHYFLQMDGALSMEG